MVKAQEWLEQNYPKNKGTIFSLSSISWKDRREITELNFSNKNLEGDLNLSDFFNLERINCSYNNLNTLNLSNCSQIKKIDCSNNLLTNLTLPNNLANLTALMLNNNNFPSQNLFFLTTATNLTWLELGTYRKIRERINIKERIGQGVYNKFNGSLDYLSNMKNLYKLEISNTDINEININKLPKSLKRVDYQISKADCKLTEIVPQLESFNNHKLCQICQELNTSENWCQPCQEKVLNEDAKNLTGQEVIEKFIQQQQSKETNENRAPKWIPYEQFTNIEYLAEGGFSKIYKAFWNEGNIEKFDGEKWETASSTDIVLKVLTDSQNSVLDFLQEIINNRLVDDNVHIVTCHGISQDPNTKDYVIVMDYIEGGNLRDYLKNRKLRWSEKLDKLCNIAYGLEYIHFQGLVHKDLHVGNILNYSSKNGNDRCCITDLGLCRPVNETNKGKIYGVLPYVAPELLKELSKEEKFRKISYTKASDIYSFGMIMYEILTNLPPYHDLKYDRNLAHKIITQGLRPQFRIKMIPQLLENLIKRCWDTDPLQRPKISRLYGILRDWYYEIRDKKNTEFTCQLQEIKNHNQTLVKEINSLNYKIHSQTVNSQLIKPFQELELKKIEKLINQIQEVSREVNPNNNQTQILKSELNSLKSNLNPEQQLLFDQFITLRQEFKKDENNQEIKKTLSNLEKQLKKDPDFKKIIQVIKNCCDELVKLELEKETEQQALIEQPTK